MAEYTVNLNLEKQQKNENISIEGFNENFDKIDEAIGSIEKYNKVTQENDGLMSKSDKKKLDEIEEKANNYTHPSTHPPSILSAGTLPSSVLAMNGTDYTASRLRNARFGTTIPTSLANGEIYFMYE